MVKQLEPTAPCRPFKTMANAAKQHPSSVVRATCSRIFEVDVSVEINLALDQ